MAPKGFNNWITNPFYQEPQDVQPDAIAARDAKVHTPESNGEFYNPNEHAKTDPYVKEESASESSSITSDYQDGIKKAESVALIWSTKSLIGAYVGYVMPLSSIRLNCM